MGVIVKRPAAEGDLIEIYRNIAADAPDRARSFLEKIYQKLDLIADSPMIGSARLPSYPEVRGFPVGNYIILYRPLTEQRGIELIRVFHGARDWQRLVETEI